MIAKKSLECINELLTELRGMTAPKPERIRKICDLLDELYESALDAYVGMDDAYARQIAKLKDHYEGRLEDLESENRDLEDRIESLEARLRGKP